jgi:hypothetical protein
VQLPTVTRNFPSLTESYGRVLATQAAREDAGDAGAPVSTLEWPPPLMALEQPAYCIACDAPRGECDHIVGHYLEPLVYTQLEGTDPKSFRWARGVEETWRTDNPQDTWPQAAPRAGSPESTEPVPVQQLIVQLEAHIDLDYDLEDLLRETYAHDPLKTSRLVTGIIDKTASRRLKSPGGLLVTRLRQLSRNR